MKKVTIIALVVLASIVLISWLSISNTTPLAVNIKSATKPAIASMKQDKVLQVSNTNRPVSIIQKAQKDNKKVTRKGKKAEQQALNEIEALKIANTLLSNIFQNQAIDFSAEKILLNFLKETNNEQVYQLIIEKLQAANIGNKNDDILVEYSLSLLAAIDSPRASEIFFNFVVKDNWQGSHAIYTIRKSITRLSQNSAYTGLIQQTFTQANNDNPFISELGNAIAQHAETEQIDYLISYIDGESENKSNVASHAMTNIKTESLVPHITSYISTNSTESVQKTALNTLASMGQYEAASALITWSTKQSKSSSAQVEELFEKALRRSPSTKRAIEKELYSQSFSSEEIRELIIKLSSE